MTTTDHSYPLRSYAKSRALLQEAPETLAPMVEAFLSNIKAHQDCNAFVEVYEEEIQKSVPTSVDRFRKKSARPLEGLVVGLKDLLCYKGHKVEGSSKILKGFVSQITATAVERLLAAGALPIGRQNSDEFGMGTGNENSAHGAVKNGLDKTRVPGGSSGGSAVGVQMKMCHVALGSDTGGSVRQPAAFCGIIGLRPTYGLVSRYGLLPYASSLDTIGILAHEIEDVAKVLGIIAGADEKDNTLSRRAVPHYLEALQKKGKYKVAYFQDALSYEGIQEEVRSHITEALGQMKAHGHEVVGLDFPLLDYVLPVYYVISTAEASANLACYDGVQYGYRAEGCKTYEEMVQKTRTLGFGKEVKRRILLGNFVLGSDQQDLFYKKAQQVRRKIRDYLSKVLETYDYIVLPSTPTTAFLRGAHADDPMKNYLADLYTVIAAVGGFPALSIPCGVDHKGLPIGLQIIGRPFQEDRLLAFSQEMMK